MRRSAVNLQNNYTLHTTSTLTNRLPSIAYAVLINCSTLFFKARDFTLSYTFRKKFSALDSRMKVPAKL